MNKAKGQPGCTDPQTGHNVTSCMLMEMFLPQFQGL